MSTGVPSLHYTTAHHFCDTLHRMIVAHAEQCVWGQKRAWYNSTTHSGWVWKGDCSSDEVVGHVFAWAALAHVAAPPVDRARAAHYLERLVKLCAISELCLRQTRLIWVCLHRGTDFCQGSALHVHPVPASTTVLYAIQE